MKAMKSRDVSQSSMHLLDEGQMWLEDLKRRMAGGRRLTEVVMLTPAKARALLSANPSNRNLNERTVESYATDIVYGRWVFNGETIIVADTGELNDGQHRCEAVCLAGVPIEVAVIAGVPRSSRTTVDMGKQRTTADFLHMNSIESATCVSAAAAIILSFEQGKVMGHQRGVSKSNNALVIRENKPTKQEVLQFAQDNLHDIKRAMDSINASRAGVVSSFSRMVAILCIIARKSSDWDDATAYINALVEGDNLGRNTPEYTVRERLLQEKREGGIGPVHFIEMVVRGWNARRAGTAMKIVKSFGSIPEIAR